MLRSRLVVICATACLATLACVPAAQAQINLTGTWTNWIDQDFDLRLNGPWPDTFMGVPINQAGRASAVANTPETISEIDRQCQPYAASYIVVGPQGPDRIWPTLNLDGTVLAWNIGGAIDRIPMTIWMDGRSPASAQAANTPQGFTTGHWLGDTLVTTTTHIQDGYLTRNGVPSSDREVMTMFLTRREDTLTLTAVVHDPVYLTAPYVMSDVLTQDPAAAVAMADTRDATCLPEEETTDVSNDQVPTFLTPPNEVLNFATLNYGIPHEAAMGGAQTMYPEYIRQISGQYKRPQVYCKTNCCGELGQAPGGLNAFAFNTNVLKCKQFIP